MIFKPADSRLWDVWCYHHAGTWYLYFLSSCETRHFDSVSVATSRDGVHWEPAGVPIRMRDEVKGGLGTTGLGTGCTWKSPAYEQDGRFQGNFTVNGQVEGESSYIRFVESADLLQWRHLDVTFRADPRWYKENYRWDCIKAMARPGGGYFGYWTAAPKERLGFGFGETDDGIHWRALPPPRIDWAGRAAPEEVEVGGVERIGDRFYALLTVFTRSKEEYRVGTFTAERPEGPFTAAAKNFHLLPGLQHSWFPGFMQSPGGLLVAHHSVTKGGCYAAPLKRAAVDAEGTLRLMWWRGNEALKGEAQSVSIRRVAERNSAAPALLDTAIDVRRGTVLEGVVTFPTDARTPDAGGDADAGQPSQPTAPGVWIECGDGRAGVIRFVSASTAVAGTVDPDGSGFAPDPQQVIDRQLPLKSQSRFRLLVRHALAELYMDDVLMNVYSLPGAASGRIGFLNGASGIGDPNAWTMTLPNEDAPRPTGV